MVSFTTGAVRSTIIATAGLLVRNYSHPGTTSPSFSSADHTALYRQTRKPNWPYRHAYTHASSTFVNSVTLTFDLLTSLHMHTEQLP